MTATAPWQHGWTLDELQTIRELFDRHDQGLTRGAHSAVNEATIADWLTRNRLHHADGAHGPYAAAYRYTRTASQLFDFTRAHAAHLPAGTLRIDRYAGDAVGVAHFLASTTANHLVVRGWIERDADLLDSLGLDRIATKVTASSELVGYWARGIEGRPLHPADKPAVANLGTISAPILTAMRSEVTNSTLPYAEHYSSYNRRHSWHALSLRGYGGSLNIEKPAEMSKAWKRDHPAMLTATCDWTPSAALYRTCTAVARALGRTNGVERVRLMRLTSNGGELSRHADTTDPDSGTADGQLMRIHVPLITNPAVQFKTWDLDGHATTTHMAAGELWYLDTRKPHAAVNGGHDERIHLVIDAYANDHLRDRITATG